MDQQQLHEACNVEEFLLPRTSRKFFNAMSAWKASQQICGVRFVRFVRFQNASCCTPWPMFCMPIPLVHTQTQNQHKHLHLHTNACIDMSMCRLR